MKKSMIDKYEMKKKGRRSERRKNKDGNIKESKDVLSVRSKTWIQNYAKGDDG
jgi:hypothetical protein